MPQSKTFPNLKSMAALALPLAAALGGCSSMRPTQQAFAPDEYEQRHPIQLAGAMHHIDIFETGRGLDARQQRDLAAFGQEYVRAGRGPMTAMVPAGGEGPRLGAIRAALGVNAPLHVSRYPADPRLGAAPVRLSFARLEARVASPCGLWPADLAGSKDAETWHNRPYHNLGCAYQSMIAAQVADPVDLVRPRPEGRVDIVKRTKDIEVLRKDQDPSTNWRKDDAKVKEAQQ